MVRRVSGRLATVVYDFARHPATARDIGFHFTRNLGPEQLVIVAHAKHFWGSAECGLHACLVGAWAAYGTSPSGSIDPSLPHFLARVAGSVGGRPAFVATTHNAPR